MPSFFRAALCNDPVNWLAAAPTPGQPYGSGDTDGDGLPDAWEIAHETILTLPDADGDLDHDGFSNWQEYLAGTDPNDANSFLQVSNIASMSDVFTLEFLALSNHTYSVVCKSTLNAASWGKLTDIPAKTTNRVVTVSDPTSGSSARFYRLALRCCRKQ